MLWRTVARLPPQVCRYAFFSQADFADNMNAPIVVLGAELQPSVSMALSRPDLQFVFISERDVIDGWDLGNVEIRKDNIERFQFDAAVRHIVLSPAWLRCVGDNANRFALSSIIAKLAKTFSNWVLPVSNYPLQEGWVLKGDLFHRPDAILEGEGGSRTESSDPYGCCNVYQRQLRITATILSMGYRMDSDRCAVGVVRVHSEAFAREDFLIAGESIEEHAGRKSNTFSLGCSRLHRLFLHELGDRCG